MAVRAPHLHLTLRAFCLGSFVFLGRALEEGDDLPFAFEEHVQRQGPALYEYRPLVRSFVESRANALAKRDDARIALDELLREPAAAIFARAHAGPKPTEEQALFRTVLLSLLISTAEACGGFDWDDDAYERAYAELEGSLFGGQHAYAAVAPLVGLSVVTQVELGGGIRLRAAATGELAHHWPEAHGTAAGRVRPRGRPLLRARAPRGSLEHGEEPPDAPAELADAVTAIRLATAAPVAAGPVLFERLDWRPFGIRPVLPIAATQPPGEPTRLDDFRGPLAARAARAARDGGRGHVPRRGARPLGALALPERAVPLRAAARRARCDALLGGGDGLWAAALRAALLLGERRRASAPRASLDGRLRGARWPTRASGGAPRDLVRRASRRDALEHGGDRADARPDARRDAPRRRAAQAEPSRRRCRTLAVLARADRRRRRVGGATRGIARALARVDAVRSGMDEARAVLEAARVDPGSTRLDRQTAEDASCSAARRLLLDGAAARLLVHRPRRAAEAEAWLRAARASADRAGAAAGVLARWRGSSAAGRIPGARGG